MSFFDNLPFFRRSQPEPELAPEAELAAPEPLIEEAITPPLPIAPSLPTPLVEAELAQPEAPAESAALRAEAEQLVRRVTRELPEFVTVAVVDSNTGRILSGQWAGHSGGAVEVAAANAELVRQTRLAIEALQLGEEEQLEDVVVTLRRQLHLLQILPQKQWLLYLAVHTQATNLALARAVLRSVSA